VTLQTIGGQGLWAWLAVGMALLLGGCETMKLGSSPSTPAATSTTGAAPPAVDSDGKPAPLAYTPAPSAPRNSDSTRSAAEKEFDQDSANFSKVVFGGFATSMIQRGLPSALACLLKYQNDQRRRNECLAVATVASAIDGISKGYIVAKRQEAGNNELRAIKSVTSDMEKDNARLQEMIDAADAMVRESQARLNKLREDVAAKRIAASDAQAERQREEANLVQLNQALKDAKATRDEYVKASRELKRDPNDPQGSAAAKRNLDAEIAAMSAKVASLEKNVKKLSDALVPFKV